MQRKILIRMANLLKNQTAKEIGISLAVITAYQFLAQIPMPFINLSELNSSANTLWSQVAGGNFLAHFSIVALGIMPFVSACVLVEICSLFIPFLKKHRGGDYKGRKVLQKYSLILTCILSAVQAKFIIQGLHGMLSVSGIPILVLNNNLQFFALLFTLVATVFVFLFLAELSTRYGAGNGISLLILSGICLSMFGNIKKFFVHTSEIQLNFFYVILFSTIIFFIFVFIPIFLLRFSCSIPFKHRSDQSFSSYFKFNSCLSGKEAIAYTTSILMLPVTLMSFFGRSEPLASSFYPGTLVYYFFSCVFVILLSYLFGWLFLHPKRRLATLEKWGWSPHETQNNSFDFIKRKFFIMNLPWSLFLCVVLIIPSIVISGFNVPFYLGGSSVFIMAFISLDFISRFKFLSTNGHEKTYKVAELQDVHHATMIKNHLRNEGIIFHLQGYYHRHLLYFFGPYIPINLLVPLFEKDRVSEIINRYYGGLGLIKKDNCVQPCHFS